VEAPSGTEAFERVGWTDDFSRGPEGEAFKVEETMASDVLLLGRVTYDGFTPVWPHVEGEFADKFNTMPKYVISSTLENPEWNNTTVLRGDVVEAVTKLKQRYERDIVVHGSPQLAQTLIEHDLVDELRLMVYPVIVGAGKRLFAETAKKKNLRLVETKKHSATGSTSLSIARRTVRGDVRRALCRSSDDRGDVASRPCSSPRPGARTCWRWRRGPGTDRTWPILYSLK
jgi:dihydrofolate reductase